MSVTKGDRVSYTVMYGGSPGYPDHRTEYGTITRIRPGGSRNAPMATIAVERPRPGATRYVERYVSSIIPVPRFTERELLNIILLGLNRIYTGIESEASDSMRQAAHEAKMRLQSWASLDMACRCCVDNECECEGRETGTVTRTGEIVVKP